MPKAAVEPCPRCGSINVEYVDRKAELVSGAGTIVMGCLLSLAFPPLLIVVIPTGIYLIVSALLAKPTFRCFDCRKKWPAPVPLEAPSGRTAPPGRTAPSGPTGEEK